VGGVEGRAGNGRLGQALQLNLPVVARRRLEDQPTRQFPPSQTHIAPGFRGGITPAGHQDVRLDVVGERHGGRIGPLRAGGSAAQIAAQALDGPVNELG